MSRYQAGQKWSYRARQCDTGSTLLIGQVHSRFLRSPSIHISVVDLHPNSPGGSTRIGHMAFTAAAIDKSVLELLETGVDIDTRFQEGLTTWSADKGEVFDIPVAQAVDAVLSVVNSRPWDQFDALVVKMRAERSEAMIAELYRQLFRLEKWYFLCCPDNSRFPAEWVFPEGPNKTPALLAFTSQERAVSAAVTLGIYPSASAVSVMPAKVRDAVRWANGRTTTWICFNLTFENFPLYCDEAARFLDEQ